MTYIVAIRLEDPRVTFKIFKQQYDEQPNTIGHQTLASEQGLGEHFVVTGVNPFLLELWGTLDDTRTIRVAWVTDSHLFWTVAIYWPGWPMIIKGAPGSTCLPTGIDIFQYFKTVCPSSAHRLNISLEDRELFSPEHSA